MEKLLIVDGTLITEKGQVKEDLAVAGGKIVARGILNRTLFPEYSILRAENNFVIPGGVDPHVHLSLPTPAGNSCDDFKTGSRAALAGGTTTLFDFVTPRRGQSLHDALHARRVEAAECTVNCHLHVGISEWNSAVASEILPLVENEGIRSFKAYLAYRESIGIGYGELEQLMKIVCETGAVLMVHCEDGEMISHAQQLFLKEGKTRPAWHPLSRPPEAEIIAIEKVIELAARTGCATYIVHISTRRGAELVGAAKKSGILVYGETCPQYLMLDDSVYSMKLPDMDVLPYVISPPVRGKGDQDGLWDALASGKIDVVATDHCPFNLHGQKDVGVNDFTRIPNGAGGVEYRLSLLYTYGVRTGRITMNRFVELISTRPAEIFGLGKTKGSLQTGYDADIVIWDPDHKSVISAENGFSCCDSGIYDGMITIGKAARVIRAE